MPFRRALAISQGDPSVFLTHPISAVLLAVAVLLVAGPPLLRRRTTDATPGPLAG